MKKTSIIVWILIIALHLGACFYYLEEQIVHKKKKQTNRICVQINKEKIPIPKPKKPVAVVPKNFKKKIVKKKTKKIIKKVVIHKPVIVENETKLDTTKTIEVPEGLDVIEGEESGSFVNIDTTGCWEYQNYLSKLNKQYQNDIRTIIAQNKFYPKSAKRLSHEGTVMVFFEIAENGNVIKSEIKEKCKFNSLNKAALKTLATIKKFPAIPKDLECTTKSYLIPIVYGLN